MGRGEAPKSSFCGYSDRIALEITSRAGGHRAGVEVSATEAVVSLEEIQAVLSGPPEVRWSRARNLCKSANAVGCCRGDTSYVYCFHYDILPCTLTAFTFVTVMVLQSSWGSQSYDKFSFWCTPL